MGLIKINCLYVFYWWLCEFSYNLLVSGRPSVSLCLCYVNSLSQALAKCPWLRHCHSYVLQCIHSVYWPGASISLRWALQSLCCPNKVIMLHCIDRDCWSAKFTIVCRSWSACLDFYDVLCAQAHTAWFWSYHLFFFFVYLLSSRRWWWWWKYVSCRVQLKVSSLLNNCWYKREQKAASEQKQLFTASSSIRINHHSLLYRYPPQLETLIHIEPRHITLLLLSNSNYFTH